MGKRGGKWVRDIRLWGGVWRRGKFVLSLSLSLSPLSLTAAARDPRPCSGPPLSSTEPSWNPRWKSPREMWVDGGVVRDVGGRGCCEE